MIGNCQRLQTYNIHKSNMTSNIELIARLLNILVGNIDYLPRETALKHFNCQFFLSKQIRGHKNVSAGYNNK